MLKNAPRSGFEMPQPDPVQASGAAAPAAPRAFGIIGWTLRNLGVFVVAACAVIAAEAFLPENAKPSALVGVTLGRTEREALRTQIDALRARAEAEAQARVDAQNATEKYKQDV